MSDIVVYPTTEILLNLLKSYIKTNLKDTQRIVRTVKAGIIDERDELPMVMILPLMERVTQYYNDGLVKLERDFRIDIVDSAYHVEDVRSQLKSKLKALKLLWSIDTQDWVLLDSNNVANVNNFALGNETIGEATNFENKYTQYTTLPLTLESFFKVSDINVPLEFIESNVLDVLDYIFEQLKTYSVFLEKWKDIVLPINLNRFPAIGVFLQQSQEEKERTSTEENNDVVFVIRIYSSLATKEIAFINHLRNIETIKTWILQNPNLDGRVMNFNLSSIDYGIDTISRPFQGGKIEQVPVFRSDITIPCTIFNF